MSLKHNKKKNGRIVYEQLMTLATRLGLSGHPKESNQILIFIKEHFGPRTLLGKEKKLFDSILETKGVSEKEAHEIVSEVLTENSFIQTEKIEKERIKLINDVINNVGKELFSIPIKDYKLMASSQILFNESRNKYQSSSPKERTKIKNMLTEHMTEEIKEDDQNYEMDNFTFGILKRKFNEKYSSIMNEDQRDILSGYLSYLMDDNKLKLKCLLESKIDKAKQEIKYGMINESHLKSDYSDLLFEAKANLDKDLTSTLNEESVLTIMKYFDLVEDLREFKSA